MKSKLLLFVLFFTGFSFLLSSQEITSEKGFIRINNMPVVERDTLPPVINLISHTFDADGKLQFRKPEINLLGKITDDKSGINRIYVNHQQIELMEDGLFMQMIPLVKGNNMVSIVAADNEDNYSEKNLIIEYVDPMSTQLRISGKYYALIIGINEYEDPTLTNLDYPVKDAENIYNVLHTEYLFDEENMTFLKNARRIDINNALDIMARKVTPDDNLLIFYAGHGWWDEKTNNGYWLPTDAKRDYKADWFRNSTLCDYIREINSKHTLLITDACFGGAIFKTRSLHMEAPKAIQMLYDLPSRKAMTSGTLTEVPDRSSFVKFLLERLKENNEKCISSEQLFASFRLAVINNSDAIPQYGEIKNVGDEGGDFIFIRR
ncbi:MAG: caspase family protein [Bacteroidales bacterium]|nr:caspase family protein [Bacteroidales bacterium]